MKNIGLKEVIVDDWGQIDYKLAWDRQTNIQQTIIDKKLKRDPGIWSGPYHLIFCQHNKVFTLGRSGNETNLLINETLLHANNISFYKINRGGDITYHGPGQLVMYPILDLENFFTDVHRFVRKLESIIISVLNEFQIDAYRNPKYTGVWVTSKTDQLPKKICAIGVHLSRWVTLHGLAFNINTDLKPYDYIIPCGIRDPEKGVTSLHLETSLALDPVIILSRIKHYFAKEFECEYIDHEEN